jgi:hypothetical protein
MAVFVSLVVSVVLLAECFVSVTWNRFAARADLRWEGASLLLALSFIPATIIGFRHTSPVLRGVYAAAAVWLGTLNYLFFAALAAWIAAGLSHLFGWSLPLRVVVEVAYGAGLVATGAAMINAACLRTTRIVVSLPHLPATWEQRTAALVTDLHLGHISGPRFLRKVIGRLRRLQPDVVLVSGDLFDGTTIGLDRLVADWRSYSPPQGIYYVTGNHDEFAERTIYLRAVEHAGVRVLNNEKVTLDGIQLIGVHDSEGGQPEILREILRRARIDPAQPSILLSHQPRHLPIAEAAGISLQLSGHTHRGQYWPWNWVVARVWGRFAYGLHQLGRLWVYTSSGAGTWGPPLRLGTRSEVVLLRFVRAAPVSRGA